MADNLSVLGKARKAYQPKLPAALRDGALKVALVKGKPTESVRDQAKIKALFPNTYGAPYISMKKATKAAAGKALNVGVVLSGGQAPGGHNVIAGIFDGIKSISKKSKLLGFLGGPSGLENGKFKVIDDTLMNAYRNTGGFDIIQSGRTKLETEEQFKKCMAVAKAQKLDAIVIIGGDDSNTNAAVLGEYFQANGATCVVCGCPKTIDGDLKNEYIETSFGFDTAVKTYSELIGNIMRDANSAQKYWHFIKLMGRSASHIALEAALQTHPNICLISEEVKAKKMKLKQVIKYVADIVAARAAEGKNFGVALIPEGLLEFIPDVGVLISELSEALAHHEKEVEGLDTAAKVEKLCNWISKASAEVLKSLPSTTQGQLMLDRDSHGNVQVSLIETEKLIIEMVKKELKSRKSFKGKFSALNHFFGYEGRCAAPSNFDADYCYSLGFTASVLAFNKMNGYMSSVRDLTKGIAKWTAGGIPITMMMNIERRHGADKPVIQKAL
ncbi:MAG: diphosphate--fructose-6-phosphate 1-phosphotransferase, partial [Fibrobacter sp.]|nr:diphosphate--fructose-6-phosphate 1-phosphotransferase [Fibrobacter sp.]